MENTMEQLRTLSLEEQAEVAEGRILRRETDNVTIFEAMVEQATHNIRVPIVAQRGDPLPVVSVPQSAGEAAHRHGVLAEYMKAGYPYKRFCELFGPTP